MTLSEFMKEDIYKNADCIEYFGSDGMELDYEEDELVDYVVIDYHKSSGGCLEIKLATL